MQHGDSVSIDRYRTSDTFITCHGIAATCLHFCNSVQVASSRGKGSKAAPEVRDDTEHHLGLPKAKITPVHARTAFTACMHGTLGNHTGNAVPYRPYEHLWQPTQAHE